MTDVIVKAMRDGTMVQFPGDAAAGACAVEISALRA